MDSTDTEPAAAFERAPTAASQPVPPGTAYLVVQAALFYLEAAVIAVVAAVLVGSFSFSALAQVVKLAGIEQSGLAINIVLFTLVAAATIGTLVGVFLGYLRLLVHPVAGHLVCAVGSLICALPVGLLASAVLHFAGPRISLYGTWVLFLAAAGFLYFLKRRVVRR